MAAIHHTEGTDAAVARVAVWSVMGLSPKRRRSMFAELPHGNIFQTKHLLLSPALVRVHLGACLSCDQKEAFIAGIVLQVAEARSSNSAFSGLEFELGQTQAGLKWIFGETVTLSFQANSFERLRAGIDFASIRLHRCSGKARFKSRHNVITLT